MSGKEAIFHSIQMNLNRSAKKKPEHDYANRMQAHLAPAFTQVSSEALLDLFIEKAQSVSAAVLRCQAADLFETIFAQLPNESHVAFAPALSQLNDSHEKWHAGTAVEEDDASITVAMCGVAETGTLVCVTSQATPGLLNFLPETCLAIVNEKDIVANYEDAWKKIRSRYDGEVMPRNVNFITGPSRTGDIEQQLLLGIHGPKKLIIILVNGEIHE